jgi:hypothetical protein
MTRQWSCPYCHHHQIFTDENHHTTLTKYYIGVSVHGDVALHHAATRCVNPACNEVTLVGTFVKAKVLANNWTTEKVLQRWQLRPSGSSKVQPNYIPAPLREDYLEACAIRDMSPKASATLARRCLQGMIRDFCGIAKNRLIDEINELRKQVDAGSAPKGVEPEAIDAIDAVRKVGNIGAHMEKEIDLIVDVDPGEAQSLIELIEMLFEEWYVARHKRQERLAKVMAVAADKAAVVIEAKAKPEPVAIPDGTEGE